jgi:hypothetical protein
MLSICERISPVNNYHSPHLTSLVSVHTVACPTISAQHWLRPHRPDLAELARQEHIVFPPQCHVALVAKTRHSAIEKNETCSDL